MSTIYNGPSFILSQNKNQKELSGSQLILN